MYKLNRYYPQDTLYCIICKKIMYMSNYNSHLKTKKHNYNLKLRNYIKQDKYILNFD
jgi:hypothetical protein